MQKITTWSFLNPVSLDHNNNINRWYSTACNGCDSWDFRWRISLERAYYSTACHGCDSCSTQVDSKPAMARCARCCLRKSIRIVNLVMLLCGAGMIIYSLWLQKKWDESIAEFARSSSTLKPWWVSINHTYFSNHISWKQLFPAEINPRKGYSASDKLLFSVLRFIYTFLGVGIMVCLSTIGGYIITNCISNSTLCFVSFLLISFIMTRRRKEPLKFSRLRHFQGLFNHWWFLNKHTFYASIAVLLYWDFLLITFVSATYDSFPRLKF